MKKTLVMLIAVLLVLAMIPASAFAGTLPAGSLSDDGLTYTVTGDVSNILDLEGLLDETEYPDLITIIIKGNITDDNLAHLAHFGDSKGADARVPSFLMGITDVTSGYPFRILPEFNTTTKTFIQSHQVNCKTYHSIVQDYAWRTSVVYVYDSSRNNTAVIDHQVVDEKGTEMLQYSTVGSGSYTTSGQNVIASGFNAPKFNKDYKTIPYSSKIDYSNSISGNTYNPEEETDGSLHQISTSYTYNIYPEFMSTVASYLYGEVLGSIEIVKTDNNKENPKPLEGAKFKIYTDSELKNEAEKFNPSYTDDDDMFVAVGEISTGPDGKVLVEGLQAGDYWIVETEPPTGYVLDSTPKKVTIAEEEIDLSLSTSSGEGTQATINKETTYWEPVWTGNGAKSTLALVAPNGVENTESVSASKYYGDVFIKGKGNSVAFNKPADITKLESYTHLTDNKYSVVLGDVSQTGKINNVYDTPSAALAYINETLIGADEIDLNTMARDHVSMYVAAGTKAEEGNFYLSDQVVSVAFEDELIPVDVDVTKVWLNDTKNARPESVKVQLFRDGVEYGDPVELSEKNGWYTKWEKLPGGFEYTVDEVEEVEDYAKSVSHKGNSWTITNSKEAPETGDNAAMLFTAAAASMIGCLYVALKLKREE